MQTVADVWDKSREYSGIASTNVRTSAIAGLAAVWLFSGAQDGDITKLGATPDGLVWAGAFFALSLALDILHYTASATAYRLWARAKELELDRLERSRDVEIEVPPWLPRIPWTAFYAKTAALLVGYVFLVTVLARVVI